jgi:hypothetical protein
MDLTSGGNEEGVDRSAMLTAIVDRLRGVSRAFSGCGGPEQQMVQQGTLLVFDLYTWSVTGQTLPRLTNIRQVKCASAARCFARGRLST